MRFICFISLLLSVACATKKDRLPQSEPLSSWVLDQGEQGFLYESRVPLVGNVKLRAGYFRESLNPEQAFKGCILYLEGLGDSILNHEPYFKTLSENGYRIITFDYMGQGGSEGSMNHTRIIDPLFPALQISSIAEQVWDKYSRVKDPHSGNDCQRVKKIILGWSTGGLAAYEMAHRRWADAVILLAPGITPKAMVGEANNSPWMLVKGAPVISIKTLTTNTFDGQKNPHIDPIRPDSPVKVPLFASNLLSSAAVSRTWSIDSSVKGLVFVSGPNDTYVDGQALVKKLAKKAPHFKVVSFPESLHEIDNEKAEISRALYQSTLSFLSKIP